MTARRPHRNPRPPLRPLQEGSNPFADEDPGSPLPVDSHPLSGPRTGADEIQPFRAVEYEETQPDRSNRVFWFGIGGAMFVAAAWVIGLVVVARGSLLDSRVAVTWPVALSGLALCVPAWILGSHDLRAIRAGVMDGSGLRRTRIGYWCGCLGTLLGSAPILLMVVVIVRSLLI